MYHDVITYYHVSYIDVYYSIFFPERVSCVSYGEARSVGLMRWLPRVVNEGALAQV